MGKVSHLEIMEQDGVFSQESTPVLSIEFDHPLVKDPGVLAWAFDYDTITNLTPQQAQQLVASLQEDYEATS